MFERKYVRRVCSSASVFERKYVRARSAGDFRNIWIRNVIRALIFIQFSSDMRERCMYSYKFECVIETRKRDELDTHTFLLEYLFGAIRVVRFEWCDSRVFLFEWCDSQ